MMATRFYLESWNARTFDAVSDQVPFPRSLFGDLPQPDSSWERGQSGFGGGFNANEDWRWLSTTALGSPMVEIASSNDTNHSAGDDEIMGRFVSGPISGQTITGTVKGQIYSGEMNAAADARPQLVIWVITPTGTVRGTLLASDATAWGSGGSTSEFSSSDQFNPSRNAKFPLASSSPATLTSVAASAGDRVVVEVGARFENASANSYRVMMDFGSVNSTDLPEDETTTARTYRPWIEFSHNFTFETVSAQASEVVVQAVVASSAPVRMATEVVVEAVVEQFWHGWDIILPPGDYADQEPGGIDYGIINIIAASAIGRARGRSRAVASPFTPTGGQAYRSNHQYRQSKTYRS